MTARPPSTQSGRIGLARFLTDDGDLSAVYQTFRGLPHAFTTDEDRSTICLLCRRHVDRHPQGGPVGYLSVLDPTTEFVKAYTELFHERRG